MITLYPVSDLSAIYRPGRVPKHAQKSKDVDLSQITPQQAKTEARHVLSGGLSPMAWRALDLLASGGVLSAQRLGVAERTLRKWAQMRLLDRLAFSEQTLQQHLLTFGLEDAHPVLYALGPVGVEIATQRHDVPPPVGYQGYLLSRVLHDVIVGEIVLRLAEAIGVRDWKVEWLGKYEGALTDKAQKQVILEPDALIRFRKGNDEHAFLIEYHNEDKQTRAAMKVEKYEAAFSEGNWRQRWEVEKFPPVLAIFWQPIVGAGYKNAVEGKRLNCTYYGKTLKTLFEGKLDEWVNVASGHKENLLPREG